MLERPTHEINFLRKPDPAPTIEVSVDSLEALGLYLDEVVRPSLLHFAEKHPAVKATVYQYSTWSVNFHERVWSTFLIVAGNDKVLDVLQDAFGAYSEVKSRFSDYIPPSMGQARFHIEDGCLWQVLDDASWMAVTGKDQTSKESLAFEAAHDEDEEVQLDDQDDEWDVETMESPADESLPRRGRLRAARSDASVGTIRQTIEQLFGLPAGSVALCGPDRRPLRADASIATLRRRWGDA